MNPLYIVAITFFSTFFGGLLALRFGKHIHVLNALSAGVLLGVVFFDLLPEAIVINTDTRLVLGMTILGFFVFYVLQRYTLIHACHEHGGKSHDTKRIGILGASGLAFHSFMDGAAIGLGFVVDVKVGIVVALAVIMHDFGDGVSTVTIMLRHKNSRARTLTLLFFDALAPFLGALVAVNLQVPESYLALILAFFAGFFLYLSTSDLLPEAHKDNHSYGILAVTVAGTLLVLLITALLP